MFDYKYKVVKSECETTYGSICVKNIVFEPEEIEKVLPDIVLADDNLKHMFAEDNLNRRNKQNIYRRFVPKSGITTDLDSFIEDNIRTNKSFYSFLAEGILGLIFRDMYSYQLAKGIIAVEDTLADSHTGVDACMYNLEQNLIVLGEAKFYESFDGGIKQIIKDFVNNSIKNKLESLQTKVETCEDAYRIVIKNLAIGEYDELTVDQFMGQKITFAGFVLHSETDVSQYGNSDFYDRYSVSVEQLVNNVRDSLSHDDIEGDYEIILVHLPIKDKKNLIHKMIEASRAKLTSM